MPNPAVFLDRDGVINANRSDYVKSIAEFQFLEGVFPPIARLSDLYKLVVVTNQSAIGRGLVSTRVVDEIHRYMVREIERNLGRVDGVYLCPHRPEDRCRCRKPQPGLLEMAAAALDLDLKNSIFIGDAFTDIEAAMRAGCQPVLVLTGRGANNRPLLQSDRYQRVPILADLNAAANWILELQEASR